MTIARDPDRHRRLGHQSATPTGSRRAVFYEVLVRCVQGLQRRRRRRPPRADREARLPAVAGRRLPLAAAVLLLAAARRRLRRRRLHRVLPEAGTVEDFHQLPRRGAQARHPRDHRLRDEPHQRRAPVVPGQPRGPRRALRRLLRVVRHRRAVRRRPDHLRRHRDLQLDVGPGAPAVLLAPVLLPPARPQLRQPEGAGGDARGDGVLARHGPRRLPARRGALPLRAATAPTARTCPRPTSCSRRCAGRRRPLPRPGAAVRGQPVADRRRRVLRRPATAATSATWPSTSR